MQIEPDNQWVLDLQGTGIRHEAALAQLRNMISRGLKAAFRKPVSSRFLQTTALEATDAVISRIETFDHRSQFKTWAMSIAVRVGLFRLRNFESQNKRQGFAENRLPFGGRAARKDTAPLESTCTKKIQKRIREKRNDRERFAFQSMVDGTPLETIAENLNSVRPTIYDLILGARKRLQSAAVESN